MVIINFLAVVLFQAIYGTVAVAVQVGLELLN
jgi:hypothetical protein